jgi:hypothetical protein
METKTLKLTADECEDIRFALARVADHNESLANPAFPKCQVYLLEQAARFRELARKITE